MSNFKLNDSVWHRVIQIVQEAMITGVDCADLMRQVEVTQDSSQDNVLTLSPEYEQRVQEHYAKMLAEAEKLKEGQSELVNFINDNS